MTRAITGELYKTSFGWFIIPEEQEISCPIGSIVALDGVKYKVLSIIPPSKPAAKWSIQVELERSTENGASFNILKILNEI